MTDETASAREPAEAGLVPDAIRAVLQPVATRRRFGAGEVVFHEGDAGDACHLVSRGVFVARSTSSRGDVIAVNVFGPHSLFGEMVLLTPGARRSASVTCAVAGETLLVRQGAFDDVRRTDPAVDRFLVALLAARNRALTTQLVDLLSAPAEQRVLRRLLAYAEVPGVMDATTGEIRLTQEELAHLAGTTRATVNRVLSQASDDGLIAVRRGRVRVLDAPALARRGGERLS